MTREEIISRIVQGEDSRTQFKRGAIGVAKLAAELTAFTNAEGGIIVFAIDDGGMIVGLDTAGKKILEQELSSVAKEKHERQNVCTFGNLRIGSPKCGT